MINLLMDDELETNAEGLGKIKKNLMLCVVAKIRTSNLLNSCHNCSILSHLVQWIPPHWLPCKTDIVKGTQRRHWYSEILHYSTLNFKWCCFCVRHKVRRNIGGMAPSILNLGTGQKCVVSVMSRALLSRDDTSWYPLNRRLQGSQKSSGRYGKMQISCSFRNWSLFDGLSCRALLTFLVQ